MANILFAGFGGQGILFAGKVVAHSGLLDGIEVSWLPSYGPEMRGGTANCSVCLQNEPIGNPMISHPDWFVALNQPSYNKFIDNVCQSGIVVYDSSLVSEIKEPDGIYQFGIPATEIAENEKLSRLANIIALGYLLQKTEFTTFEVMKRALESTVPPSKTHMLQSNYAALEIGYKYKK